MPQGTRAQAQRILEERTRLLARRGQAAEAGATRPVLLCALGGEICGLPLGAVARILPDGPYGALPGARPPLLGLIGAEGRAYGLLDLALALGRATPCRPGGHILLLRHASARFALRTDRALGVETVRLLPPGEAGTAPLDPAGALEAYAQAPGAPPRLVGLIDPIRLLQPVLASVQLPGA